MPRGVERVTVRIGVMIGSAIVIDRVTVVVRN
jgi:hypothetical protein